MSIFELFRKKGKILEEKSENTNKIINCNRIEQVVENESMQNESNSDSTAQFPDDLRLKIESAGYAKWESELIKQIYLDLRLKCDKTINESKKINDIFSKYEQSEKLKNEINTLEYSIIKENLLILFEPYIRDIEEKKNMKESELFLKKADFEKDIVDMEKMKDSKLNMEVKKQFINEFVNKWSIYADDQRDIELTFRFYKIVDDELIFVKGGTFQMGDEVGDLSEVCRPVHSVSVSDYFIRKTAIKQDEWKTVMGNNPSLSKGNNLAVEGVSWYDAIEFCNKLSASKGLEECYLINKKNKDLNNYSTVDDLQYVVECNFNAKGYRLPTEAEWEFAARGGSKSMGYKYSGSNNSEEVSWFCDNEDKNNPIKPVALKKSNELGIYDMSGNSLEWCWDWHGNYSIDSQTNPSGLCIGTDRVIRSGPWGDFKRLRNANRDKADPSCDDSSFSFRVVKTK